MKSCRWHTSDTEYFFKQNWLGKSVLWIRVTRRKGEGDEHPPSERGTWYTLERPATAYEAQKLLLAMACTEIGTTERIER